MVFYISAVSVANSPFSCHICLSSFSPLLGESSKRFVNIFYPFIESALGFIYFFLFVFWTSFLLIYPLIFTISFLLLSLGFVCFLILITLGDGLSCWFEIFSSFLRMASIAMTLPLRTAFAAFHRFRMAVFKYHLSGGIFNFPFDFLTDPLVF